MRGDNLTYRIFTITLRRGWGRVAGTSEPCTSRATLRVKENTRDYNIQVATAVIVEQTRKSLRSKTTIGSADDACCFGTMGEHEASRATSPNARKTRDP